MDCSLSHTIDEIKAGVQKLIDENTIRPQAIIDLVMQFSNAQHAKDDLRKPFVSKHLST